MDVARPAQIPPFHTAPQILRKDVLSQRRLHFLSACTSQTVLHYVTLLQQRNASVFVTIVNILASLSAQAVAIILYRLCGNYFEKPLILFSHRDGHVK